MDEVHSAIHLRAGQRALVELFDAWLLRHRVEVVACADVYDACVHLLKNYAQVPELALIGADWLGKDEFNIVPYVRQTWPRTGIVVYGGDRETPIFDVLPLVETCGSAVSARKLVEQSPTDVLRRLVQAAMRGIDPRSAPQRTIRGLPGRRDCEAERSTPANSACARLVPESGAPPSRVRRLPALSAGAVVTPAELAEFLGPTR